MKFDWDVLEWKVAFYKLSNSGPLAIYTGVYVVSTQRVKVVKDTQGNKTETRSCTHLEIQAILKDFSQKDNEKRDWCLR